MSSTNNTGITFGSFDLLHAGHLVMLEQCKLQCEKLIVGLQTDPTIDRSFKNKPVQSVYERFVQLKSCQWVDEIIPYDTEEDLINILSIVDVQKRFLSEEYKGQFIYGNEICKERNIQIVFLERKHNYSSTILRENIYARELSKRTNNPS